MKHYRILLFILFASSLAVEQPTENYYDGNHLLPKCQAVIKFAETSVWKSADEAFDVGYCHGLVRGIAYGSPLVCLQEGVTPNQEVRVVVKFLEDNPEKLNLNGAVLTEKALSRAFPCQHK